MQNELEIVRDVSVRLEGADIAFMLTGSMAMNFYAQPRMSGIDIVLELVPRDVDKVLALFHPAYYASREAISSSILHHSMFNLIHQESVIKVDCIIRKESAYRRTEFDRRRRIALEDFATWIVTREDLIISKLFWAKDSHSELQLRDVRNLIAKDLDRAYVDRWTRELGLSDLWTECQR